RADGARARADPPDLILPYRPGSASTLQQPLQGASAPCAVAGGVETDPVLFPATVDELARRRVHLDLDGPRPGALLRPLRGRVDAELAADELALGRVVEVV